MSTTGIPPQPEQQAIDTAIQMAMANAKDQGLRGAHPKAHGCVKAEFRVDPGELPQQARVGVFREKRTFEAWIRFSNAQAKPQDDTVADVRGMAIKLLGVEGKKLLEKELDEKTQDFILISHPVFFARNTQEFLVVLGLEANDPRVEPFRTRFTRELGILKESQNSTIKNPLGGEYWSTVPFRHGDFRVKYHARSSSPIQPPADTTSANFLRESMKAHLGRNDAQFEFSVQFYKDDAATPVEDPTLQWSAPFVKVATIVIPKQDFTTNEQLEFCENLSFTPWHSLVEHEPLGAINLARKPVYDAISAERHATRKVPRAEPK
jgi:hypothetical protein